MIKVVVCTNTMKKEVTAEVTETILSVLERDDVGINVEGSVITLKGMNLSASDLFSPFSTFDINDGDIVRIFSVVKMQGGKA